VRYRKKPFCHFSLSTALVFDICSYIRDDVMLPMKRHGLSESSSSSSDDSSDRGSQDDLSVS